MLKRTLLHWNIIEELFASVYYIIDEMIFSFLSKIEHTRCNNDKLMLFYEQGKKLFISDERQWMGKTKKSAVG